MFPIIRTRTLAPAIREMEIEAPRIARKQKPGQFVLVRVSPWGERIPLTIKDADPARGTIKLVVQGVGKTTNLMNMLEAGDALLDVAGPLGTPSEIRLFGTAVVIGGGVGTAIAYPVARALKEAGNTVISIVGARSKDLVILEDEVRAVSDVTYIMTDDGSYGEKGLVIDPLKNLVGANGRGIDFVLAIGPIPMMRAVADVTRPDGIHTVVSLNSIMVDGTGMCGGCRVLVDNDSKFACVDGPEFDAHKVDFTVLAQRNGMYRENERVANERFAEGAAGELAEIRRLMRAAEETANV